MCVAHGRPKKGHAAWWLMGQKAETVVDWAGSIGLEAKIKVTDEVGTQGREQKTEQPFGQRNGIGLAFGEGVRLISDTCQKD